MRYLSLLKYSHRDWAKLGIHDAYGVHKVVYDLFPQENNETRDFLFCDKGGIFSERRILILSEREPVQPLHGSLSTKPVSESFLAKNMYSYEISLSPSKRSKETGKIVSLSERNQVAQWFCGKAPKLGFETSPESMDIVTGVLRFRKGDQRVTIGTATIKGVLKVCKREPFIESFQKGIGRGKAFGLGLLQLLPIN